MALGRRYRLIPVRRGASFHPKLCIRLGPVGAVVACGSHNLTRAGWLGCRKGEDGGGGNREATLAWRVEPGSADAANLRRAIDRLAGLPALASDRDELRQYISAAWLAEDSAPPQPQPWTWEVVGDGVTLARVLEDRWKGRRFRRLRMVTGSTDQHAAVIRWAAATFGVSEAVVEVDLAACGFDPAQLAGIGIDLRIQPYDGNPRTHLKLALFESPDGCAAVVGSANCSGAAWLRSAREGGNIESVVILDACDPANLAHLYRGGLGDAKPWADVALAPPATQENRPAANLTPYALKSLQLHRVGRELTAVIHPAPEPDARLFALVQTSRVPLSALASPGTWRGPMPDLVEGPETLFGHVEIETPAGVVRTELLWVDDVDRLGEAAGRHHRFDSVRRLSSGGPSGDYRRLLEDLQVLSRTLLTKSDEFPDGLRRQRAEAPEEGKSPPKPVTAAELIRTLDQLKVSTQPGTVTSVCVGSLSLSGIMAVLFAEAAATAEIDPTEAEHQRSNEEREQEQSEQQQQPAAKAAEPSAEESGPSAAQRKRLFDQLGEFLDKLTAPTFSATCSARQLQQAAAFPLAVARFASRGPWVGEAEGRTLAALVGRACEILFFSTRAADPKAGQGQSLGPLVEQVRARYSSQGRAEDFEQIVGDGTLWLVLIGSLAVFGGGAADQFERNLVLRDVARYGALLAKAVPEQLAPLASRLGREVGDDVLGHVENVVVALDALETHLRERFEGLPRATARAARAGDWLWNTGVGFARLVELTDDQKGKVHIRKRAETVNNVMLGYYCNVRVAAESDPELGGLLSACVRLGSAPSLTPAEAGAASS